MFKSNLTNWNHYPVIDAEVVAASSEAECMSAIKLHPQLISRGLGRSYGDASLGKVVLDCSGMNRILEFDITNKTIVVEAGVSIDEILKQIVPSGLFLPVVPGTRFITIGGAIAADIHGKNHHIDGTFTRHVEWIEIIDESLQLMRCSPSHNTDLFVKTCGGMGISGVIIRASLKLISIDTSYIRCTNIPFYNLRDLLNSFEQFKLSKYSVAWLDTSSGKGKLLNSVLMLGEHECSDNLLNKTEDYKLQVHTSPMITIPKWFPSFLLNNLSINIFNRIYFLMKKRSSGSYRLHYEDYFFPLDKINWWNRLYGKRGFIQYQCLVPANKEGEQALNEILLACSSNGMSSFLSVLKGFGEANPLAHMSFPAPGYTLSMDLKMNKGLIKFLDELDIIVENCGGKLYLAKDARMNRSFFQRSYPKRVVSNRFVSLLSQRLGLNSTDKK